MGRFEESGGIFFIGNLHRKCDRWLGEIIMGVGVLERKRLQGAKISPRIWEHTGKWFLRVARLACLPGYIQLVAGEGKTDLYRNGFFFSSLPRDFFHRKTLPGFAEGCGGCVENVCSSMNVNPPSSSSSRFADPGQATLDGLISSGAGTGREQQTFMAIRRNVRGESGGTFPVSNYEILKEYAVE